MAIPISLLLDLIAVYQIKEEGFDYKLSQAEEEADFFRIMGMK